MNNQDGLHDDQDGVDPKLQQLYRQLPKEQPSTELDARVLAAAKIVNQKKTQRWQAPFALAASVVMVSSVAFYIHEENPAAFDISAPTTQIPAAEIAKSAANHGANVNHLATAKPIDDQADHKVAIQKAKHASFSKPEEAQMETTDNLDANDFKDSNLKEITGKKVDIASRADQMTEIISANQSAKSMQSAAIAREQEIRQAKTEPDQFATAARAPAAYAPAPVSIPSPAPQVQLQPEVSELKSLPADRLQANRLQDSNNASRQLSAAMTESDQPLASEKSKAAPALSAAPMAATPMNLGAVAGSAMSIQHSERDEATTKTEARTDTKQNMSTPVLNIEGVTMGMSREQLVVKGLTCYIDVCHLDLSQPQQEKYWGMPTQNGHLTAFLSLQVVTKMVFRQKNAQLNQVTIALSNVGIASQQSCREEKGTLLIGRQFGANIFNVRSIGEGLSLTICQQAK